MTLTFRHFKNTDPPAIVEIWRNSPLMPGQTRPVSIEILEPLVFGKTYFEHAGFIIALEDDHPIGFAHAGFGPNQLFDDLDYQTGIICLVLIDPQCAAPEKAAQGLIDQCESYLRSRGATTIYGGAIRPITPFYTGLYGGSEPPGILETDQLGIATFGQGGYRVVERTQGYQLDLTRFRQVITEKTARLRRQVQFEMSTDAPTRHWWEACTLGDYELNRLVVKKTGTNAIMALGTIRAMEPISPGFSGRSCGLMDIRVAPDCRDQGVATYALSEAFRRLAQSGCILVEAQANESDKALNGLLHSMGMQKTHSGVVFRKNVPK